MSEEETRAMIGKMQPIHCFNKKVENTQLDEGLSELEEKIMNKNIIGAFKVLRRIKANRKLDKIKHHARKKQPSQSGIYEKYIALLHRLTRITRNFLNDLVASCESSLNEQNFVKSSRILGLLEGVVAGIIAVDGGCEKVLNYISNAKAWMEWVRYNKASNLYRQYRFLTSITGMNTQLLNQRLYELERDAKKLGLIKENRDEIHVIPA